MFLRAVSLLLLLTQQLACVAIALDHGVARDAVVFTAGAALALLCLYDVIRRDR